MLTIPGRIPIHIHPLFGFLVILISWMNSNTFLGVVLWSSVIFISVLLHEFGHALTASYFGQKSQIHLVALGGITQRQGPKLKLWQEFLIVLNGPLTGIILFLLSYASLEFLAKKLDTQSVLYYFLEITMYANIFWTIVNLLPVHPLDGGRLFSIVMEAIFGPKGGTAALLLSSLLALAVSLLFFAVQAFLGGALFLMFAFESYRSWKASLAMTKEDHNQELQLQLIEAESDLRSGREALAVEKLQTIRQISKKGVIYVTASEHLATLLSRQGHIEQAYQMLLSIKDYLSPDAVRLLHQLAYQNNDWNQVVAVGDQAYQVNPGYDRALVNSYAYAALGKVHPSIGWLSCAIRDGLPNPQEVLRKHEYNGIRLAPEFLELERKLI